MGQLSEHWKCFATDKSNNLSAVQGTSSGVDLLEACQDNNIPTPTAGIGIFHYICHWITEGSFLPQK